MFYLFVVLAFLISVVIASMLIPRILLISARKRLFDEIGKRKVHKKKIPRLGGVSFFPTILFTFCFLMAFRVIFDYDVKEGLSDYLRQEFLLLICGLTLLYLVGIADDLIGVRYRKKFLIQIICASLLPISGVWINNFYGILGLYAVPDAVGVLFTVFIVVLITNAINLIDGIDGLASGLSSAALLMFGILFMEKQLWAYSMLAFATFGVLVPFFYYNVFGDANRFRKIFMGDTGSLTLGYILSFLAVNFCMYRPGIPSSAEDSIVIAFSTLLIPIFDAIRVVLVRVRKGQNPFQPDRNHIHHKFLDMGFSTKSAMVTLILISICFSVLNLLLIPYLDNNLLIFIDIVLWIGLNLYCDRVRKIRTGANRN